MDSVSTVEQLPDVNCYLGEGSSAPQSDWQSMGSSRDEMVSGHATESLTGGSLSSTANTSPAMSASMDTDEASRDMMTMHASSLMDVVSPCTTSSMGQMNTLHVRMKLMNEESAKPNINLHFQDSSLGYDAEVSSTVVQDTPPQSNHQQHPYSEDSSSLMISSNGLNIDQSLSAASTSGISIYTAASPQSQPPVLPHSGNVLGGPALQYLQQQQQQKPLLSNPIQVPLPQSQSATSPQINFAQTSSTALGTMPVAVPVNPIGVVATTTTGDVLNGTVSNNKAIATAVIVNTVPLVPTLGRPPSVKISQLPVGGSDNGIASSGVVMNARAPGAPLPVRMKVAGSGVVIPGSSHRPGVASGGGRGRGQGGGKNPPGAVNLERSYQICQAVIQNSPNRHQLRCQLRPPAKEPSVRSPVPVPIVPVPVTDTQNPMVTSSNRLVRVGGVAKQTLVQRQPSPVMMRPVMMPTASLPVGNMNLAVDTSLNVPRANSAPPGQQFPVSPNRMGTN